MGKVRPDYEVPAPDVSECERSSDFNLVRIEALLRMKLTAFRDKDRMHLRDLIDVGLVDDGWANRLPAALAERLQRLLEEPEG